MSLSAPINGEEIARAGQSLYEQTIRASVEPEHNGKFIVLNVETGEYEMDADDLTASLRARDRFPDAPLFTVRVGHPAAYRIGGTLSSLRR